MNKKVFAIALATVLFGALYALGQNALPITDAAPTRANLPEQQPAYGGGSGVPAALTLTVNQPVEIPGHVLQAGNYTLEVNPFDKMVLVSTDAGKAIGLFPVIASTRVKASGAPDVVLAETSGTMMRIAEWYFSGDVNGYSFVYPKAKHRAVLSAMK